MKKFLFAFAAVLVLLIGAALIAPSFIDWTRYRDPIAAEIERAAGRKVVIAGTVEASLLPTPRLLLNDARLGNLPGAAEPEMARLRSLEARIALLPLLSGQVVVESFVMREPVVTLEVLKDGRRNWIFDSDEAAAAASRWDDEPFVAPEAVQLQNASIVNGTVIYKDARSGTEERFEQVNARVVADSLAGPLRAAGEARVGGKPLRFTLAAGRYDFRSPITTPLNATLDLMGPNGSTLRAGLAFNGTVQFAPSLQLDGKTKLGGADFAAILASFGKTGDMPGFLAQPFNAEGTLKMTSERAEASNLVVSLGDVRSQGSAAATFVGPRDGKPQLDLALTFGYIDLDAWLDMPARQGDGKPAGDFVLPSGFRLALDTSVEAVNFRKGLFRQIKASAELDGGAVTLKQFTVQAPGGTDATVNGRFTAEPNVPPRFDGQVDLASDDFRGLLGWTGLDAKTLPAGRLTKLTARGRVGLGVDTLELSDLDARFDSSRLTGGVVTALRARPAFGANLTIDQINLDAYMPEGSDAAFPMLPPDMVAGFDANLLLRAGQLTWRQVPLRDLALDGTLDNGDLALRKLSAGVATGQGDGAFTLAGEVKSVAAKPVVTLDLTAQATDPAGLYRLMGIANMPIVTTGGFKLAARVETEPKGYRFPKIDAAFGAATVSGEAMLAIDGPRPKLTGKLALGEIDTAALLGVPSDAAQANRPWSDAPLGLFLLKFGDADLDLTAKSLAHKGWRVADASAHAVIDDGSLAVESLAGKLLGGDLTLDARLTPPPADAKDGVASLEGSFALAGATAARGLFGGKSADLVGGKLDLALEFSAKGNRESALIATLSGKGQYALHDATLRGVDLAPLAKRLPALAKSADLQAALKTALAGDGKLASLDGSYSLENGRAASDDLTMQLEGASGEGELRVNLTDWTLDGGIEFKLAGDEAAPPVQLRLTGALSAPAKTFDATALEAYVLERAAKQDAARQAKAEAERQAKAEAERRAAAERAAQQRQQQQQRPAAPPAPPAKPSPPAAAQPPTPPAAAQPPTPPAAAQPPASPSADSFINDVLEGLPTR